jgi:hypothetical protein
MPDTRSKNAEKQKRFREKQRQLGKKQVRSYLSPEATTCYEEIQEITQWTDNDILNNALRITYAAYKKGQINLLNQWLKDNKL